MLLRGLDADIHVNAVDKGAADTGIDGCYRISNYILSANMCHIFEYFDGLRVSRMPASKPSR